jgi:hypothetical protein
MSPKIKKFAVLALSGVVGAAVSSGLIPGDVGAFLAAHAEALVLFAVGLVLPEIGKKAA